MRNCKISGTKWEIYNSYKLGTSISFFEELALDKNGNILIGGSGGVSRYNGTTCEFLLWGSSANPVWRTEALEVDDTGKIWIGGNGEGLVSFDPNGLSTISELNLDLTKLIVYPNPTEGIVNIEIKAIKKLMVEISVINLIGIEIFRKDFIIQMGFPR